MGVQHLRRLGLRQISMLDDLPDFMGKPALREQFVSIVKSEIGKHIALSEGSFRGRSSDYSIRALASSSSLKSEE